MFTRDELIGGSGAYKTQSLFLETSLTNRKYVIMTLSEHSKEYNGKNQKFLNKENIKKKKEQYSKKCKRNRKKKKDEN